MEWCHYYHDEIAPYGLYSQVTNMHSFGITDLPFLHEVFKNRSLEVKQLCPV